MRVEGFRIDVPEEAVIDLRDRLRATQWPTGLAATGWEDGAAIGFIRALTDHWANDFSWHEQQERLNRLPQFIAHVADERRAFSA